MHIYDTSKSEAMLAQASKVIPGGLYGHYAGALGRPGAPDSFPIARVHILPMSTATTTSQRRIWVHPGSDLLRQGSRQLL